MNKLFSKIATLSVGLAMAVGVGVAAGKGLQAEQTKAESQTATWTATNGGLGSGVGSGTIKDSKNGSWSYTRTLVSGSSYTGWSSSCIQLGKNGGVENLTLSTSSYSSYTIASVAVECASYQGKHNVSITVGETAYLESAATSSWTTVSSSEGTGSSSGNITIEFTGGTRALYIKSITVTYNDGQAQQKGISITGLSASGLYLKGESYDVGYETVGFDSEPTITNVSWTVPSGAGSIADGKWTAGSNATENVKLELDLKANGDDYHAEVTVNIDEVTAFKKSGPKTNFSTSEVFTVGHTFIVEYQFADDGTVEETNSNISYRLENQDGTKIKDVIYNETKFVVDDSGKYIDATYKGVDLSERYSITVFDLFDNTVGAYYLVSNVSELSDGDHITFFGYYEKEETTDSFVPASFGSNNIVGQSITLDNGAIDANQNFTILDFIIRDTSSDLAGSFAFEVSNDSDNLGKYLYAAGKSSNNLKTQSPIDANARFVVTIDGSTHVASVAATESNNRSHMNANENLNNPNRLFSCYASSSDTFSNNKLYIYKWVSNADKVQEFIDNNMKMDQYAGDETYSKDRCEANYEAAKAAYLELTASQKELFINEGGVGGAYEAAFARFMAWVDANGDQFNVNDGTFVRYNPVNFIGGDTSGFAIIIVISTVSVLAFGLAIMLRKKHR